MTEWIITSGALILAVLALRQLFRDKITRRLRYALWSLVLLRLLMPFSLLNSPLSVMNAVDAGQIAAPLEDIQVYSDVIRLTELTPEEAQEVGRGELHEIQGFAMGSGQEHLHNYIFLDSLGAVLARLGKIVWLAGSVALGLWFAGVNLAYGRKLRRTRRVFPARDCPLPVYVAENLDSPCLFGVFRPAIYLTPRAAAHPTGLSYVLLHEVCHYRQGDHIWPLFRGLCLAVWWWNPLVWAAALASRADGELACDEAVIRRVGAQNRLDYGLTLVDMIALRQNTAGLLHAATTMISGRENVKGRIQMIIKNPKALLPAMAAVVLAALLVAGCTFTGRPAPTEAVQPDVGQATAKTDANIPPDMSARPSADIDVPTAALSAQEALEQLISSVVRSEGRVMFTIPADYGKPEAWNIHIAGRQIYADGFSRSVHLLEDLNDAKAWEAGRTYTLDVDASYTELNLSASLPGAEERIVTLTGFSVADPFFDNIALAQAGNSYTLEKDGGVLLHFAGVSEPVKAPLTLQNPEAGFYISPQKTAIAYGGGDEPFRVLISDDAGQTWDSHTVAAAKDLGGCKFIGFISSAEGFLVASGGSALGTSYNFVFLTADGGKTWTEIGNPNKLYPRNATGAGFSTREIGFISFRVDDDPGPTIYRTTDGGVSWEKMQVTVPEGFDYNTPLSPLFSGATGIYPIVYRAPDEQEYMYYLISNDYGMTWSYWDSQAPTISLTGYMVIEDDILYLDAVEIVLKENKEHIAELKLKEQDDYPSGYHIHNPDKEITAYTLTDETEYCFVDFNLLFVKEKDGNRKYTTMKKEEFLQHLKASYGDTPPAQKVPFFIEVQGGKVVRVTERFEYTI